jgi:hypothetical protein
MRVLSDLTLERGTFARAELVVGTAWCAPEEPAAGVPALVDHWN